MELLGGREFEVRPSAGSGLGDFRVKFFAASCDSPETNRRYAKELKLDYPVLSDPDKQVAAAYGVVNDQRPVPFRWTFFIGVDGKILYIDKSVKTGTHGADIAARLQELGIAKKENPVR